MTKLIQVDYFFFWSAKISPVMKYSEKTAIFSENGPFKWLRNGVRVKSEVGFVSYRDTNGQQISCSIRLETNINRFQTISKF